MDTMDKTVKILVIVFALAIAGYIGFVKIDRWHKRGVESAAQQAQELCRTAMDQLENEIAELKQELEENRRTAAPMHAETISGIFGESTPMVALEEEEIDCGEIEREAMALLRYLDEKRYLDAGSGQAAFHDFFAANAVKAAATLPRVNGELDDILSLLRNVTHFYRVFGKSSLLTMKTVMENESDLVEPGMAVLFAWITTCRKHDDPALAPLTPEVQYEYAAFFLHTLGGRSYLLRRESKVRTLVTFYSIRILDMANDERLNHIGVDIRPHIDALFYDIMNQTGLSYRDRYLSVLANLRGKYQ